MEHITIEAEQQRLERLKPRIEFPIDNVSWKKNSNYNNTRMKIDLINLSDIPITINSLFLEKIKFPNSKSSLAKESQKNKQPSHIRISAITMIKQVLKWMMAWARKTLKRFYKVPTMSHIHLKPAVELIGPDKILGLTFRSHGGEATLWSRNDSVMIKTSEVMTLEYDIISTLNGRDGREWSNLRVSDIQAWRFRPVCKDVLGNEYRFKCWIGFDSNKLEGTSENQATSVPIKTQKGQIFRFTFHNDLGEGSCSPEDIQAIRNGQQI